ncbi:TPA: trigger factor [Candidatus Falkowbacteria bacterium]|nr:trigger factor [Candidatus Falkowbacteria bacterium]
MQVVKKELPKSQLELSVELSVEEFAPYIPKGAEKVAATIKIEGFRPGKVPYEILKQKIGEMTILEEAAHLAIHKTIDDVIEQNTIGVQAIGQPQVNVTKLAPNNPLEYKIVISCLPSIALGKYKDLGLKPEAVSVEDKEIEKSLHDLREMRAQEALADRAIGDGDKVVADIKMFLDKVPLEDGQHQGATIIVGKDYFVPGFDKQLLGAKKGEEKKFSLPYPDNHHQKNIAGKLVEFAVTVKDIYSRTLPELNDEFAGFFRLKTLAELKTNLKESLEQEKKRNTDLKNEAEMISKIIADTKFGDLPDVLVESESRNIMTELETNIVRQGGKFEDYLGHLKKTREALQLELLPNAVKRVKSALVIREIAVLEKIMVSDKEIADKIAELKKQYADNKEVSKVLGEAGYTDYLRNILTNEKVIAQLKEWNYAPAGTK